MESTPTPKSNFVRQTINRDLESGKNQKRVATRFPPEPNGYLHIGHAKSICLNFGLAKEYEGTCNLRFDDTNPAKEKQEFIDGIQEDIKWLGFSWEDRLFFASDYFEKLYEFAVHLIKEGKAYVDSLSAEETKTYRGTLTQGGKESPHRSRSVEENLDLFEKMRNGEFQDGEHTLRAKIDMNSPNINLRDPTLYRIRHIEHPRTENKWCIYPMYDYAHCVSDALEKITHSICTLEFEDHRPLYDWTLEQIPVEDHPQQIEFSKLRISYILQGKRKMIELVESGLVSGWDDPRLSTLKGLRRRGFPAAAIRNFCEEVGVTKKESTIDILQLENAVRMELDQTAPRAFSVVNPLKVVIENYPEGETEEIEVPRHPKKEEMGTRKLPFSKTLYIEKDDFMEAPPKKYFRLSPGKEVRLRYAYFIKCEKVIKDDNGEVIELRCTYDPESKGTNGNPPRKVKGIVHWLSAEHARPAEIRLYDRLFKVENPTGDFDNELNPDSLKIIKGGYVEPSLAEAQPEDAFQFERLGYFNADRIDHGKDSLVFNRVITLRDAWAKINR